MATLLPETATLCCRFTLLPFPATICCRFGNFVTCCGQALKPLIVFDVCSSNKDFFLSRIQRIRKMALRIQLSFRFGLSSFSNIIGVVPLLKRVSDCDSAIIFMQRTHSRTDSYLGLHPGKTMLYILSFRIRNGVYMPI